MTARRARFNGSIGQLQQIVALTGIPGAWDLMPTGYWRYRAHNCAILNWWPSTGTFNFQGRAAAADAFERALIEVVAGGRDPGRMLPDLRGDV